MGWSGKIVGGTIGAIFGGPVGAAVGAGLGHFFDDDEETVTLPATVAELNYVHGIVLPEGPGLVLRIAISGAGLGSEGAVIVRPTHMDTWVQGTLAGWTDDDGDIVAVGDWSLESPELAVATIALPYAALPEWLMGGSLGLVVTALGTDGVVAQGPFHIDLIGLDDLDDSNLLGVLGQLGVALVQTVSPLDASERRRIRAYLKASFELDATGTSYLANVLVRAGGRWRSPDALADRLAPLIEPGDAAAILDYLHEVAASDGAVDPGEQEFISRFCRRIGIEEAQQQAAAQAAEPSLAEFYEALELAPDATKGDIKKAHRRLALQYHPDKVVGMAPRFQQFATEEMRRINAARDALLRAI